MFDSFYLFKKFLLGQGFLFIPWDITGSSRVRLYLLNGYMLTGWVSGAPSTTVTVISTQPSFGKGKDVPASGTCPCPPVWLLSPCSQREARSDSFLSAIYTCLPLPDRHLHRPKIISRGKDFFTKVNIFLAPKRLAFVREGLFSCSDRGMPIFTLHPDKT